MYYVRSHDNRLYKKANGVNGKFILTLCTGSMSSMRTFSSESESRDMGFRPASDQEVAEFFDSQKDTREFKNNSKGDKL